MKRFLLTLAITCIFLQLSVGQTLLADFPFNGNANDESTNANNGTVFGATLTEDRFGNPNSAYLFDGVDDYIDFGNDPSLDLKDGLSLSLWYYRTSNTYAVLAGRGFSGAGDYSIDINSGGNINIYVEGNLYQSSQTIADGWNHIVINFNSGLDGLQVFLNGILINQFTSTDLGGSSIYSFRIGSDELNSIYSAGIIDDVYVFDGSLSQATVKNLFVNGKELSGNADFGNALNFDNNNEDYLKINADLPNQIDDQFTFETWIYWEGGSSEQIIFEMAQDNTQIVKLTTSYFSNYTFDFDNQDPRVPRTDKVDFLGQLPINQWAHLALRYDLNSARAEILINGQIVASSNSIAVPIPFITFHYLGRGQDQNYFNGTLDDIRMWSTYRSSFDILVNQNRPLGSFGEDLIYYFDFEQGKPFQDNRNIDEFFNANGGGGAFPINFNLEGLTSNLVDSDIAKGFPFVTSISSLSAVPNKSILIYSNDFDQITDFSVSFGGYQAEIVRVEETFCEVLVPEVADEDLGRLDLVVSNGSGSSFARDFVVLTDNSNKELTFKSNTIFSQLFNAFGVKSLDFDHDGFLDVVASGTEQIVFLKNDGNGEFSLYETYNRPESATTAGLVLGDINKDGNLDVITSQLRGPRWITLSNGQVLNSEVLPDLLRPDNGAIGNPVGQEVEVVDIDSDGLLDIFFSIQDQSELVDPNKRMAYYRNLGGNNFDGPIYLSSLTNSKFAFSDLNDDGYLDAVLTGQFQQRNSTLEIHLNDGNGNLVNSSPILPPSPVEFLAPSRYGPRNIFLKDLDGDNLEDLLVADRLSSSFWLKNLGGLFSNEINNVKGVVTYTGFGDIDGDGDLDLINSLPTQGLSWSENKIDEDGTFPEVPIEEFFIRTQNSDVADFDNDGDLDIVIAYQTEGVIQIQELVFADANIETFTVEGQINSSVSQSNKRINVTVPNNFDLFSVEPVFQLSKNASAFVREELQISGFTSNDFRQTVTYVVVAEDGTQENWSVTMNPLPGNPIVPFVDEISQDNAKISWSESSFTDSYDIEVSSDNFNSVTTFRTPDLEYSLDLSPGTSYQVRIESINGFGSSASYSEVSSFITIPETPIIETIDEIKTNSAITQWNDIPGASQYRLELSIDSSFTNYVTGYNSKVITTFEENILGLNPGIEYWLRVRSQNESGFSPTSPVVSFITKPDVPSFTFDEITQNAFAVKWNSVNGVDSVQLEIDGEIITFDGAVSENTFSELEPGSTYSLRIRSSNVSGSSVWSSYQEVTLIPQDPVISAIDEISEASAVANWTPARGALGYILDVARDEGMNNIVGGYGQRLVTALSEPIIGLSEGVNYYVRVLAINEAGVSNYSEIAQFLTKPETPTFRQSNVSFDNVTFDWVLGNGQDGFDILQLKDGDSTITSFDGSTNQAIFSNLLPASTYQFSIRSFNTTGFSDYSIPVTIATVPAIVGSITLQNVSQSTAVIAWEDVVGADDYLLEITENDFSTNVSGYNPKTIAGASELVQNLSTGTPYRARIRSSNDSGPSQYSEELSFTTIPGNPTARDASNITATAFNANWDNVAGSVDTYIIEVADDENFENMIVIDESNSLTYAVTGLSGGVSHWYRIAAKNTSGQSSYSNTVFVKQALIIGGLIYEADPSKATTTEIPVSFTVTGGTNIHHVTFRYRGILNDNWISNTITSSSNQYEFIILSSFMDDIGLEFEILVDDGVEQVSNLKNFIYWQDIEEDVNTISLSNQWQMFSIPYFLDNSQVGAVFDEMAAFKYRSQWRLMHYNGQAYLDANGGGIADIELGKGYWFYTTEEDITIDIGGGTVNTESPFTLNLRQGWNQIGNPYNVSINWSSVRANNQASVAVEELLLYNTQMGTFFENGVLDPFNGAFVWSNEDRSIQISLADDKSIGGRITTEVLSSNIDLDQWQLNFTMETNGNQYPIASIGMDPNADKSRDELDRVTYPRFVNYLEMHTLQTDYFYPYFRKDIRPSADQMAWHFTIASNFISQGELKWDNSEMENAKHHLWLVDEKNGTVIHMNETNRYASNFSDSYSLSIYLTEDMTPPLPLFMHISDPYPNPTSNQSSIQLILPDTKKEYAVKLNIVDLSGREVVSVAEGAYQAGRHDFMTDLGQLNLKSGVYFYRLFIDDMTSSPVTKKLILTK